MKHTRKKICAGLLSALLALSLLTGCGGGQSGGDVSDNQSNGDVSESQSNGDVSRNSPGGPPEASTPPPVIGLTRDSENHYEDIDDRDVQVNRMDTALPGTDADTHANYPELAAALDRFREDAYDEAMESYQAREEELPDFIEMGGNGGDYALYGATSSLIRRADAKAVSVVNVCSEYSGGTHANYSYTAANFDATTGEEIALESLLTDEGAETLNDRIGQELDALYPDLTLGEKVAEYAPEDYTFSVDPDGVTFWFSPGEIANPGHGLITVKLYFSLDADMLNDTYEAASSSWFVELAEDSYRFIAANGSLETAEVWSMVNEAADGAYDFSVDTFYAHIPHGDYFVMILVEDGDPNILVYRYNGESDYELVQHLNGVRLEEFCYPEVPEDDEDFDWDDYTPYNTCLTNPDDTWLYTYSDLFGSWNVGGSYRLTDSGFELQQDLLYGDGFTLTFAQDFTVTRCAPDDWTVMTDEEITIPEMTEVDIVAVNEEQTTAYFRVRDAAQQLTGDDEEFIFALSYDDGDEWPRTVNGIDEDELLVQAFG